MDWNKDLKWAAIIPIKGRKLNQLRNGNILQRSNMKKIYEHVRYIKVAQITSMALRSSQSQPTWTACNVKKRRLSLLRCW